MGARGELRGTMTAMVTPFDASDEAPLNLSILPAYLDFQRAAGIDGVVVCGTNGEGVSLSVAERKQLLEAVHEHRGDLTVIAGTGAANLPDTLELTHHAGDAGADAVLVLPPFFFKNPTAQGIADFFQRVLDVSPLPVFLYSIPQMSAIAVTDEVLDRLAGHPKLAGMKDSAGQWERTHALLHRDPNFLVFPGSDDLQAQSVKEGSIGSISGTANAFPELVVGVRRAYETGGDVDAAQARLDVAKTILLSYPLIGASKSVLAHRGVPRMGVRPPLINLTAAQEAEMLARFREAGLLNS